MPYSDINQIVSANLARLLTRDQKSPEQWAERCVYVSGPKKGRAVSPRKLRYLINGEGSPSLDIIAAIAKKAGLLPWHLLVPNLDIANPPVVHVSDDERDIYHRIAKLERRFGKIGAK